MFLRKNWAELAVGERLRSLRERYEELYNRKNKNNNPSAPYVKLTQDYVSENVGMKRNTLSRIESGSQELRLEEIIKLADFYEVSCDTIIRGVEPEYAKISSVTGLSSASIQWFQTATREQKVMVDTIFKNKEIADDLITVFNLYANLHIPATIKDEDGANAFRVSYYLADEEKLLNAVLTEYVQTILIQIRNSTPVEMTRRKQDDTAVQEALKKLKDNNTSRKNSEQRRKNKELSENPLNEAREEMLELSQRIDKTKLQKIAAKLGVTEDSLLPGESLYDGMGKVLAEIQEELAPFKRDS